MKNFKSFISEISSEDLADDYKGLSSDEISKRIKDIRKYSPQERANLKKELVMRSQVREDSINEISDKAKQNYIDAAKDDHYNMWNARGKYKKPKNPNHYTPTGKLKKGVRDRPAAVEYRRRLDQRAKYINKTNVDLHGKKQFSGIEQTEVNELYYLQPDGTWKNNGDGRSVGKTKDELKADGLGSKIREAAIVGSPGNNTTSGPGMGSDSTLKTRKARLFKDIYRRHGTKKENTTIGVVKL